MNIRPDDCTLCDAPLIAVDYLAPGAEKTYEVMLDREPVEAFLVDPKRPQPLTISVHLRHSATCESRGPRDAGATEQETASEVTPEQTEEKDITPAAAPSSSEPPPVDLDSAK